MNYTMQFKLEDSSILELENVVYCLTNVLNGKKYVGMTMRKFGQRLKEHVKYAIDLREGRSTSTMAITHAINVHGCENFLVEILQRVLDDDDINDIEKFWIEKLKSFSEGYNLTTGGYGINGWTHSEETRKRMSEKRSGENNPQFGKSHKGWGSGVKRSDETRQKLSKCFLGKTHTEDARRRIGDAARIHKRKAVYQCSKDGLIIQRFESLKVAAHSVGGQPNKISEVLRGGRKSHKGYLWKYVNDFNDKKSYRKG